MTFILNQIYTIIEDSYFILSLIHSCLIMLFCSIEVINMHSHITQSHMSIEWFFIYLHQVREGLVCVLIFVSQYLNVPYNIFILYLTRLKLSCVLNRSLEPTHNILELLINPSKLNGLLLKLRWIIMLPFQYYTSAEIGYFSSIWFSSAKASSNLFPYIRVIADMFKKYHTLAILGTSDSVLFHNTIFIFTWS